HSGERKTALRFNAALPRWDRLHSPHARALTFDMRGGRQQAKPDVARPLDGRVRHCCYLLQGWLLQLGQEGTHGWSDARLMIARNDRDGEWRVVRGGQVAVRLD